MMSKKTRSGKEYWVQTDAQAFADWYYSHLNKIVHTHLDEDHGVWFSGKPVVGAEPRRPISMLMGEEIQAFIAQQKHEFEMLGEIADTTASPPALAEWIIGSLLRGKNSKRLSATLMNSSIQTSNGSASAGRAGCTGHARSDSFGQCCAASSAASPHGA
jgi:hypothetical protein